MLAILMAGGKGERLRPLTYEIPKPLIEINNKKLIDYALDSLLESGIKKSNIVVCLRYRHEAFIPYLQQKKINYFVGSSDYCVRNMLEIINIKSGKDVLVLPSDIIQPSEVIRESIKVYKKLQPACLFHAKGRRRTVKVSSLKYIKPTTSLSIWNVSILKKIEEKIEDNFEYSDLAILLLAHNYSIFYFYTPHTILEIDTFDDLKKFKKQVR
ncbi:MAG: sugar phosphate nucleotidyltransferase [Candidatus Aenigmatarchaeota archaeon]